MTDNPTPTLKDNSPEEVAFKLMKLVIQTENRSPNAHAENPADRKYLLDTYAECLITVRQPQSRNS